MTSLNIAYQRLYNQHISETTFETPGDVVKWLGAVQAQDYIGALWALGLRMKKAVEADIEQALADKTIVRTWPMRGTLHFVAAADVRWMLGLLTPRIVAVRAQRLYQQLGLDEITFGRCEEVFVGALQGGRQLTRAAMYERLEAAHISTADGRGLHILGRLAQDGLLCFGTREGKQQTFTLLDEWVPTARRMARDEALAELSRRYFTSHGPATLQDFVWWSGLRVAEAKAGIEMAKPHLAQEVIDGQTYWLSPSIPAAKAASPTVYLLPAYDEYTVAYKDRSAVLNPSYAKQVNSGNGIIYPMIVVDGQVVGTWKRALKKDALVITPSLFAKLNKAESRAFQAAASRYGEFLGASVVLP
jgi:hypothetical protein